MRNIHFRGKNFAGQWVYGDLITRTSQFYKGLEAPIIIDQDGSAWSIQKETVGQYITQDRNDKPIYEGDTLLMYRHCEITHKHEPGKIWNNGSYVPDIRKIRCSCGTFFTVSDLGIEQAFLHMARPGQSYEVVGNIHDKTPQHESKA